MPKGRLSNPSTEKDGKWFYHDAEFQNQFISTTSSMLKKSNKLDVPETEKTLPMLSKILPQKALNMEFPFSQHDNRHALQDKGEYFDTGLGRKKPAKEKNQRNSLNFNLWCHERPPEATGKWDGFTNYQTSYVYQQNQEPFFYRRYPKDHLEKYHRIKALRKDCWTPNYDNFSTPICSITASDFSPKSSSL
ncbi:testis-expressed protein 36 [Rhinatrema bivittatum]|uniref:testis-expressed protein 36 n=1 Tax=Rhinatrema bivittatum TaxID=194408 RepID=UPI00112845DF|nr:testis-expressed protein 36 [Rhinatrema bivittatum]